MPPEKSLSSRHDSKSRRILVAEDNLLNGKIVGELLRKEGYRAAVVTNGREALEALASQPFDAVVLDYQMPEMDGLQTLRAIRSHSSPGIRLLPVLFFTAEADEQALELVRQSGVSQTLQKPVDPTGLLTAVAALWNSSAPTPAPAPAPANYLHAITDGDATLIVELMDIFMEEAPAAIGKMKDCRARGEWAQLLKILHRIRSNYTYVGMEEGEALLRLLEEDVEKGERTETYAARIARLETLTGDFMQVLLRKKQELLRN